MRNLLLIGLLAVAIVAVGCKSKTSPDRLFGPLDPSSPMSGNITPPTPPAPPVVTPAMYGAVSNLNLTAGTFTIITPGGDTASVTFTATTIVRYQGLTSDVAKSNLKDGENVTVTGAVTGLPQQARVRAQMIIINSGTVNQNAISGTN